MLTDTQGKPITSERMADIRDQAGLHVKTAREQRMPCAARATKLANFYRSGKKDVCFWCGLSRAVHHA